MITEIHRQLFAYTCADCGKKRETRLIERAQRGVCQPCLKLRPMAGQTSFLDLQRGEAVA